MTKDELLERILKGQRSFSAVNLPAVYALEHEGLLQVIHEATEIRFEEMGIIGTVAVRLTPEGESRLRGTS